MRELVKVASVALAMALGFVATGVGAAPGDDLPTPEKRGCCSHHKGVCGCEDGRAKCCDGTFSPSCGC